MTRLMCLDLITEGGGIGGGVEGWGGGWLGCTHNIIIDARIGGEKGTEKCKF